MRGGCGWGGPMTVGLQGAAQPFLTKASYARVTTAAGEAAAVGAAGAVAAPAC